MKNIPKCPKCRAEPVSYTEILDASTTFHINSDDCLETDGFHEAGYPKYVYAKCRECGYEWTLRGVVQITDVREIYEKYGRLK